MKLACFSYNNKIQLGVAVDENYCLSLDSLFPSGDMAELINSGQKGLELIRALLESSASKEAQLIPLGCQLASSRLFFPFRKILVTVLYYFFIFIGKLHPKII